MAHHHVTSADSPANGEHLDPSKVARVKSLALGVAAGLGTAWLEATQIGAAGAEFSLSPIERVLLAGRVAWFYLGTLLWPAGLAFFYPRWTIDAGVAWQGLFPLATLAVLAAAWGWRRRSSMAAVRTNWLSAALLAR
jgi:MYXO-CTERM domain-containing protein